MRWKTPALHAWEDEMQVLLNLVFGHQAIGGKALSVLPLNDETLCHAYANGENNDKRGD